MRLLYLHLLELLERQESWVGWLCWRPLAIWEFVNVFLVAGMVGMWSLGRVVHRLRLRLLLSRWVLLRMWLVWRQRDMLWTSAHRDMMTLMIRWPLSLELWMLGMVGLLWWVLRALWVHWLMAILNWHLVWRTSVVPRIKVSPVLLVNILRETMMVLRWMLWEARVAPDMLRLMKVIWLLIVWVSLIVHIFDLLFMNI
jgi:hypothetical protein